MTTLRFEAQVLLIETATSFNFLVNWQCMCHRDIQLRLGLDAVMVRQLRYMYLYVFSVIYGANDLKICNLVQNN